MLSVIVSQRKLRPGEIVTVKVEGDTSGPGELRLFWYTEGKGDQDVSVVKIEPFSTLPYECEIKLPLQPWSVSGELLTLLWAVEAVQGTQSTRETMIVSPTGEEITLGQPTKKSIKPSITDSPNFNARG